MKILHINASYKPAVIYGGPTVSVAALCEQLAKGGDEVTVFTTTANGGAELPVKAGTTLTVDGVEVIYFSRLTGDHTHFSPALLTRLWRVAKNYDVIHIHAWWNLVSVLSCWIALLKGVPVVVSPRGTLSSYTFATRHAALKKAFHRWLGKSLLGRTTLHATSEQEAQSLLQLLAPGKLVQLPNLVHLPALSEPGIRLEKPPLKVIFLARIDAKKGLDLLVEALPLLNSPYRLTVAGDGDRSYILQLKALAKLSGVSSHIRWIGFQGERDKFRVLQQHDLFVLPSHDENFGNSVIESLSVGTPVLLTANVGLSAYVRRRRLGWVCEPTREALAEAVNRISDSRAERERIRRQAPASIYKDFDPSALAEDYRRVYRQTISPHG